MPRPPASGPASGRAASRTARLQRLPAASSGQPIAFNHKSRLPPLGGATAGSARAATRTLTAAATAEVDITAPPPDSIENSGGSVKSESPRTINGKLKSASTESLLAKQAAVALNSNSTSTGTGAYANVTGTTTGTTSQRTGNAASDSLVASVLSDSTSTGTGTVASTSTNRSLPGSASSRKQPRSDVTANDSAKLNRLTSVLEDEPAVDCVTSQPSPPQHGGDVSVRNSSLNNVVRAPPSLLDPTLEAIIRKAQTSVRKTPRSGRKYDFNTDVLMNDSTSGAAAAAAVTSRPVTSASRHDSSVAGATAPSSYVYKDPKKSGRRSRNTGLERLLSDPSGSGIDPTGSGYSGGGATRPATTAATATLEALKETLQGHHHHPTAPLSGGGVGGATSNSKRGKSGGGGGGGGGGVVLESLNPSQVRAVSGVLSSFVASGAAGNKSRSGFIKDGRIPTPETRLMVSGRPHLDARDSAHGKWTVASRRQRPASWLVDGRISTPETRLMVS